MMLPTENEGDLDQPLSSVTSYELVHFRWGRVNDEEADIKYRFI